MQEKSHYRQLNAACCKFEKSQKIILVAKELIQTNDALSRMGEQNVYSTLTHLAETNSAFNNSKYRLTVTVEKLRGGGGGNLRMARVLGQFLELD